MPRLSRKWLIGGPLLLVVLGGVLWVYARTEQARDRSDPERARRKGQPIPVRTAQVTESQVEDVIGGTATTAASETGVIQVSPSTNFNNTEVLLKAVHVREGDHVHEGQLLFELDERVMREYVKQNEATVASALATLERTRVAVANAQRQRDADLAKAEEEVRYRETDLDSRSKKLDLLQLMKKDNAASQFELLDQIGLVAEGHFNIATARDDRQIAANAMATGKLSDEEQLAIATTAYETARANLEAARRDLNRCRIVSPTDGFMDQVTFSAGQVVVVNTTLTQVLKLDPIDVRMDFPQERIGELAVGQPARVILDAFPGQTYSGAVIRIAPLANAQLRVVPVVIRLGNPENRIRAGITGYVRVTIPKTSTTVPATAVLHQGGKSVVFRVEGGRAHLREVTTGPVQQTGELEVRAGLAPGDQVVVFHNFYRDLGDLTRGDAYLQDNDLVDVDWKKWAGRE